MTPQELKNSILQLAFRGKLTEQYTNDSSVDELIANCRKDKIQAIKDGKIKKDKFIGAIKEEYDIPDNWRLMYISDATLFQEGPGILAVDFRSSGIPLIRISGMQTNRVSLEGCNYLDPSMVEDKWKHFRLDVGDILISTSASMDKVCEVFDDCAGAIPYTGQIRFKMYGNISREYFKWYVQSPLYNKQILDQQAGAAIKHYGPTHLKKMTIPIAPVEEQKRIVAKIEELLPLIDRYGAAWSRLEDFNKRFPNDMQKSILQMAIQGKLVEQRPEEGTAEELYKQIQAEKQSLIKAGKLKKEKPLPTITDDEKPFDIPDSWKWVRLRDICTKIIDGDHNPPAGITSKTEFWMLSAQNISNTGLTNLDQVRYLSGDVFLREDERTKVQSGDIFFTIVATLGRSCVYEGGHNICFQRSVSVITTLIYNYYLKYSLDSSFIQSFMVANATGTAQKGFYLNQVERLLIPIPPIAEQKRIVAKLEELLPLCERLK